MTDEKAAYQLLEVRQWSQNKIDSGDEPPWAWYQYMKLIETIDSILGSSGCVSTTESSRQPEERPGAHLQLVDATYQPDNVQPHPSGLPVLLPM